MGHRPASELIQSLRCTLRKLEQTCDSQDDESRLAELKRILLLRIADLEFVGTTVELADAEKAKQDDDDASLVPDEDDSNAA